MILTTHADLLESLLRSRDMMTIYPGGRCSNMLVALCPNDCPYYATLREFFASSRNSLIAYASLP